MSSLKTGDEGAAASAVTETESADASEHAKATKPAEEEPAEAEASKYIEETECVAAEASKEVEETGSTSPGEQEEKNFVQREVVRIQEFVGSLSLDDLQGGDWFVKLLAFSLSQ